MAQQRESRNGSGTVRERVVALEIEQSHMADDISAIRKHLEIQSRYFRAGVLLGTSAVVHLSSEKFEKIAAGFLELGFKILLG